MKTYPISESQSFWLDLARGLAALLVATGHIRAHFFGLYSEATIQDFWAKLFFLFFGLGHESVMLFFVMSGLLIAPKFLNPSAAYGDYLAKYAVARLSRIYIVAIPALLLSIAVAWTAQGIWGFSHSYQGDNCRPSGADLGAALLFLNNGFVETICSLGPYWSIHNEVFYYFLWPAIALLFLLPARTAHRIVALAFLAIIGGALFVLDEFDTHNTLLLFPIWVLGGLSVLVRRIPGPFVLWAALAFSALIGPSLIPGNSSFLIEAYVLGIFFTLFFIAARDGPLPGPKVRRTARWLADISFSLYLTHIIMLNFVQTMLHYSFEVSFPMSIRSWSGLALFIALTVVVLAFAQLAYLAFERNTPKVRRYLNSLLIERSDRPA